MVKDYTKKDSKFVKVIRKMPHRKLHILLSIVIVFLGIGIAVLLIFTHKAPVKSEREKIAPLVKVQQVRRQDIQMIIAGYGTVQPKVQAEVVPQVSGKVVEINPNFKDGGFIKLGRL